MSLARIVLLATACAVALSGQAVAKTVKHHKARPSLVHAIQVPMDNVALVTFKRPVATVYVGNTSIAEPTMLDSYHAFVLGKRFGGTNLIALDMNKSIVANDPVTVGSRSGGAITIYRGADSYNYTCTSAHCETHPVPGDPDGAPYFDNTEKAANAHEDDGNKAAQAGVGSSTASLH